MKTLQTVRIVIKLSGLILICLMPDVVWCHVFPEHSEPEVGETITVSPSRVRIWFDGALEPVFSNLLVQNTNGQQIDKADSHVDASDPTLLEVSLPPLPHGTYRVIWNAVARDGHRTTGDYTFTIE
jgi:methionine-rich copper-binding protein CopC